MSRYLLYDFDDSTKVVVDTYQDYKFSMYDIKEEEYFKTLEKEGVDHISVAKLFDLPLYLLRDHVYTGIKTLKVCETEYLYYKMLSNEISHNCLLQSASSSDTDFIYFCEYGTELYILTSCDRIFLCSEFKHLFANNTFTELDLSMYLVDPMLSDMSGFFKDCKKLKSLNLKTINLRLIYNFNYIFSGCELLEDLKINMNDVHPYNMVATFKNCKSLQHLSLKNVSFKHINTLNSAFGNSGITSLYLKDLHPKADYNAMCYKSKLKKVTLILREEDVDDRTLYNCEDMFFACEDLTEINSNIDNFIGQNVFTRTKLNYEEIGVYGESSKIEHNI